MRLKEFTESLRQFSATVRVVLKNATTTSRTTINADSSSHAYLMLSRLYGVGNVLSLSELVNESPQANQIHLHEFFTRQVSNRQAPQRKIAQKRFSQATEQRRQRKRGKLVTRAIADPIKHGLVQDMLTKQFVRQSNIVKPTTDDIRIANSRAQTALKKADLEYKKKAEELLRRRERERRRRGATG